MANCRLNFLAGGSYFFTVDLADRRLTLLNDHILTYCGRRFAGVDAAPFTIEAAVILPGPSACDLDPAREDANFALRWRLIKTALRHGLMRGERMSTSRLSKGERGDLATAVLGAYAA
jgi:putative transposase